MKIFGFENYIKKGLGGLDPKKKWAWKPAYWNLIKNPKSILNFNSTFESSSASPKKNITLLLSRKTPMIGHVIAQMKKQKMPYVFVNWDEFVEEGTVVYDQASQSYQLRYKKSVVDLTKVKSVYFDYFELKEVYYFSRSRFTSKEQVFLARWLEALTTLEAVCINANWFPAKPSQMEFESQNKFGELLLAKKLGFNIPKMIYSNDPREVRKFLKDKKAILKESGLRSFTNNKNDKLIFDAKAVSADDKKLDTIQSTPCMFQEFIAKQYDIRAVVIGKKVLAAKIDSQKNKSALSDWRGSEHLIPFTPYKIPKDLEKKLIRFTQHMGFSLANIDIVRGEDNRYYFLEMNRPGQWFFVESLSGIPVTKTLVKSF